MRDKRWRRGRKRQYHHVFYARHTHAWWVYDPCIQSTRRCRPIRHHNRTNRFFFGEGVFGIDVHRHLCLCVCVRERCIFYLYCSTSIYETEEITNGEYDQIFQSKPFNYSSSHISFSIFYYYIYRRNFHIICSSYRRRQGRPQNSFSGSKEWAIRLP